MQLAASLAWVVCEEPQRLSALFLRSSPPLNASVAVFLWSSRSHRALAMATLTLSRPEVVEMLIFLLLGRLSSGQFLGLPPSLFTVLCEC